MADTKNKARWKIIGGYAAFSLAAFIFGLYVTFPYDTLKTRVVTDASGSGMYVRVGSLGPGLFGITASNVEVSKKMEGNEDKPPIPLKIRSVAIRPSLFPLGVAVRAKILNGTATAAIGMLGDLKIRLGLDDLNLADDNLKAFSGMSLAGKLNGQVSFDVPQVKVVKSQPAEPDLAQASGSIALDGSDLMVNGGSLPLPDYGNPDLPKIALGDLDAKIKFDKGVGTIDRFHAKGDDVEVLASGTLKLAKRVDFSEPNIELKVKANPEFVKRLGLLGAGLSILTPDRENPDFRDGRLSGFLSRPNFTPGAGR